MTHVLHGVEFDAKHERGSHGRFAPGITRPKLLKRDERAVVAVGGDFHPADLSTPGHAAAVARAHPTRVHPDTVGAFHDLAKSLRSATAPDVRVKTLDDAMKPTTHDLVVTRHLGSGAFGLKADRLPDLPEMLRGRKIIDRAYTPAALHQAQRDGGVTLHIAVPKGTRAAMAGDNEVWLDRDLEMAVTGVYANGRGGYAVELTVLPTRPPPPAAKATKATKNATPAKATPKKVAATTAPRAAKKAAPPEARPAKKAATTKATKATAPTVAEPGFPSRSAPKLGDLMRRQPSDEVRNHVRQAIGGTFGGLNARVHSVHHADGAMTVQGTVHNLAGTQVGSFVRQFERQQRKLVATHEFLQLDRSVQGSGFARQFNANLFDWYRRSGFDRAKVHANIDVGGYTWATQGFDFEDSEELGRWLRGARAQLEYFHQGNEPSFGMRKGQSLVKAFPNLTKAQRDAEVDKLRTLLAAAADGRPISAYEVSQVGRRRGQGRDDMWIGKFLMLGSSWMGALRL